MRFARWLSWGAVSVAASSCTALPEISEGACGNAVLERNEDCDGFGREGLECRPPGEPGQCHLDCSPSATGTPTACPTGYGCDANHACRKATGSYLPLPERILGSAYSLIAADFDGDGRADIASTEEPLLIGVTKLRTHYFDREAVSTHSWTSNDLLATPTLIQMPGIPQASLAAARSNGVGLISGELEGNLISEALPSYFLEHTGARVFGVLNDPIGTSSSVVILAERDGQRGLFRQGVKNDAFQLVKAVDFELSALAAEPVLARLFDDPERPCFDVVLGATGARELGIHSLCELDESGAVAWRDEAETVTLSVPAPLSRGVIAADLDGDGHGDLLVGTTAGTHVAYGDGTGFTDFERARPTSADQTLEDMPIAAGDLSGDDRADLVMPRGVYVSDSASAPRALRYKSAVPRLGHRWTEAVIADLNRDGLTDAAAISDQSIDVTFLNGTGSQALNPFTISTDRRVLHLGAGDFDGDLITDLAVALQVPAPGEGIEVSVAFGNLSGAPSAPRLAARLPNIKELVPFRNTTANKVSFLGMVYEQTGESGTQGTALAFLSASSERNLPCVVDLSRFGEDGSLRGASSLSVTVGAFVTPGVTDVAAIALGTDTTPEALVPELWLLKDITSRRSSPRQLGWTFPPEMQVVGGLIDTDEPKLSATMAPGDLDGDDVDELVMTAPDAAGSRCLLSVAKLQAGGTPLQSTTPIVLEGPCISDTQVTVVDLDEDGARDVLVLFGGTDRQLLVFWNDGTGAFSADSSLDLWPSGADLRSYSLFHDVEGHLAIAAVSDGAAHLVPAPTRTRTLTGQPATLTVLSGGTGVVAADVDGDGVEDLAIAESGAVRILRAELAP